MTADWNILTGEYPPQPGGVSDYSALIARGLVEQRARVTVWAPACRRSADVESDVIVRRLRRGFQLPSLVTLGREMRRGGTSGRVLVQYVPQAFGHHGMNLAFCWWLTRRREPVWTMFHEVLFPRLHGQSARHRVLAAVTRVMARVVARASERMFVSTPAWGNLLRSIAPGAPAAEWLPVPSTIARTAGAADASDLRRRYGGGRGPLVGHFGSYGPLIANQLGQAVPALLERVRGATVVLLGAGGAALRRRIVDASPALSGRVWAAGPLDAHAVSLHLRACDLMLQPFEEGVTTRRTSVMAALLHGAPTVTTSGRLTEPLWQASGAVALAPVGDPAALAAVASTLLEDSEARRRLAAAGCAAYDAYFDVRHTIAALQQPARRSVPPAEVVVT